MYKILIFLKKKENSFSINDLMNDTFPLIRNIDNLGLVWYKVDSNLLMENIYSHIIELSFVSKDEMDRQFNTAGGKALQKNLMGLQQSIDILFVSKEKDEHLPG